MTPQALARVVSTFALSEEQLARLFATWDETKHPRGQGGKWIEVYHGTTEKIGEKIRKEGLKPKGRYKIAYVTDRKSQAQAYAAVRENESPRRGDAVLVTIRVPAKFWRETMKESFTPNVWETESTIPAKYISKVELLKRGRTYDFAAESTNEGDGEIELYVVVDVDSDEAALEYAARRPLYVRRDVLNAPEIIEWAKANGFETTLNPDDMHVTCCYSKRALNWDKIEPSYESVRLEDSKGRTVEALGDKGAVVLKFQSLELQDRFTEFMNAGASWDYEQYTPHITITYQPPVGLGPAKVVPYDGPIVLGPEIFEEIDEDAADGFEEYEFDPEKHPRHEAGDERGGEFAPKGMMVALEDADEEIRQRAAVMKLPPAWKDVRVSVDAETALQATGIDSKGRKQYVYSVAHSEAQAAEKFERLKAFAKAAPWIEGRALKDMQAGNHAAAATYLIAQTGFRVGSDDETGAAVKAFGASTLLREHVSVSGDKLTFNFVGKKGVNVSKTIENKPLVDFIRRRDGRLFDTSDAKIRDYVKDVSGSDDFKVKDFRTWHGTAKALEAIKREMRTPPVSAKEYKSAFVRVKKEVAAHLGNTPAVAFASYIDPAVWGRLEVRHG